MFCKVPGCGGKIETTYHHDCWGKPDGSSSYCMKCGRDPAGVIVVYEDPDPTATAVVGYKGIELPAEAVVLGHGKGADSMSSFTFTDALLIALRAHKGQKDKGGEDYIKHPLHLAHMIRQKGYSEEIQMVGLLHDVLEDSSYTVDELLRAGCPSSVVDAVKVMTRSADEDYLKDYIPRIKKNVMARAVKIEDLLHNSDFRRIPPGLFGDAEKMKARYFKYATALNELL